MPLTLSGAGRRFVCLMNIGAPVARTHPSAPGLFATRNLWIPTQ